MSKRFIFSLLFTVSCLFANGQENSWTLQKCIETALKNSIDIKIKQLDINRARKTYTNPLLDLFPTVGARANHSYNFGSTIDPNTNNRVSSDIQWDNFDLNANMNLLDFSSLAEARKHKMQIELAKADKAVIEYEYKLKLLEQYFITLYTQELIKIMKEQFVNTAFNRNRIEKEVGIGNRPKSDLYDIELVFSQEEKAMLETEQLYQMQKLDLFQLMNFEEAVISAVVLEPYFPESNQNGLDGITNPKLEFAELSYKISKSDVSILRSDNLPKLSAFYGFSTFYSYPLNQGNVVVDDFSTQIGNNKNHQAGLQLTIPVFNGFKSNRRIAASRIESEKTKWVSEQEKIRLSQQINAEKTRQNQYLQLKEKLERTFKYAEASFKTIQAKFISGKTEAVIYTSVKNQLLSSEYDVLKNNLQLQYTALKINLLQKNGL
jgi:outer membrane protein